MRFEDILTEVGGFGRYQKTLCFLLIPFSTGVIGLVYYAQLIILFVPPHTCSEQSNSSIVAKLATHHNFSGSSVFLEDINHTETIQYMGATVAQQTKDVCLVAVPGGFQGERAPCSRWDFDYSTMFPTISSENGWLCDEAWRPYTILTAFWVGNMVGAWCLGLITDRWGRRPVIFICFMVYGVAGLVSAFVTNYYGFLALRVLTGTAHSTLSHLPYVLVMEYCDMSTRVVPLFTIMITYTLATMVTPGLAYLVWDWKTLVIVTSSPALLILLVYRWVPESASWLLTQGRTDEATKLLHHIASVNKKGLTYQDVSRMVMEASEKIKPASNEEAEIVLYDKKHEMEQLEQMELESSTLSNNNNNNTSEAITSILKYPLLRKQIFTVMFIWMIGCMCYYGHTQNTSNLGDNLLMSYFLGSVMEVPAWSAPWIIERFGRRPPLVLGFVTSGTAGIVYCGLLAIGSGWAPLMVGLLGRLSVTAAYYIGLQYGPEVFPTVVRGQGVALAETLGGVAILLSPMIVYLAEYYRGLPLLVFGIFGCIAGAVTLLLPETKGVTLPNTLQEAENVGQELLLASKRKGCMCC